MEPEKGTGRTRHYFQLFPLLLILAAAAIYALSWYQSSTATFDVISTEPIMPQKVHFESGMAPSAAPAMMETSAVMSADLAPASMRVGVPGYPLPPQGGAPDITDTREFLKTSYSATILTRKVQELIRRAETTIRGHDGRVDAMSSSEKNGYISFVVPVANFEKFREEIESFVPPKFIKVDVASRNLLSQKQNIEASEENVKKNISDLEARRKKAVADHTAIVGSLNRQIDDAQTELDALRSLPPTGNEEWFQRLARENELTTLLATLRSRLSNENANYKYTLDSIDQQLKYANQSLEGVREQDENLMNDVATVNGTINFRWISLWEVVEQYVPVSGTTIATILMLAAIGLYLWGAMRVL